jgi:tripartite-type tricarboxylate transporter receptor subunit TctC
MDVNGWFGCVAPAATPAPVLDRLNAAFAGALAEPEVRAKLTEIGADPTPGPRSAFAAWLTKERARWSETVRSAGIRIE